MKAGSMVNSAIRSTLRVARLRLGDQGRRHGPRGRKGRASTRIPAPMRKDAESFAGILNEAGGSCGQRVSTTGR